MKLTITFVILASILMSCQENKDGDATKRSPTFLVGTWKLITAMVIDKSDTLITDYTKNKSFIKIINDTHFAFLQHDLKKGKDSAAVFVAGGGSYFLSGNLYTEHLEYCSDRNWEGNDFKFTIDVKNDTLIQSGVEKVASAGVDRTNIEKYIRVKK